MVRNTTVRLGNVSLSVCFYYRQDSMRLAMLRRNNNFRGFPSHTVSCGGHSP